MKYSKFAAKSKRKGITPVIAIVLLLMMTVAAAGMAYVWIMSLQEQIQQTGQEGVDKTKKDASAALSIESGWNQGGNLYVALKNAGTYTFSTGEVAAFTYYINGQPKATATTCTGLSAPSTICQINTAVSYPSVGSKVVVKVDAGFGNQAVYSCMNKTATDTSC